MNSYKEDDNNIPFHWKLIFGIVLFLLLTSAAFFVCKFFLTFSGEIFPSNVRDDWGTLGDFFGGILNPIFGFASFIALLATIFYQSKELNASTKELRNSATALTAQNKAIELQSFEQTFFSWINTYRDLLNSISSNAGSSIKDTTGRTQLYNLWNSSLASHAIYSSISDYDPNTGSMIFKNEFSGDYGLNFESLSNYKKIEIIGQHKPEAVTDQLFKLWSLLYHGNEYQIDSLFRTVYRLLIWIDSQQPQRLNSAQKWLYVSIIRSQLSWIEMVYLYYNGLTGLGSKFKILIEKYALFDNLSFDSDIGIKVMNKHLPLERSYSNEAFSSELAREKLGLPKSSEDTLALATTTS
jgi:uncharacterized membrane protein